MRNYMLSCILLLAFAAATASNVFAGKVVSWQFDETSGTTAVDSTGNGNDGVLGSSFTTGQWIIDGGVTGEPGDNAIYMNGDPNNSVIAAGVVSDVFLGSSDWTCNFWVKFDGTPGMTSLGGFGDCEWDDGTVGNPDRHFASWNNGLEFEISGDGFWPGTNLEGDGQWRMLTATHNATSGDTKIYVDGEVVASGVKTLNTCEENAFKLNSGGWVVWANFDNQVPVTGWMDDYGVWDEAKTDYWVALKFAGIEATKELQADFNVDGIVNLEDFAVLTTSWMECNWVPQIECP